MHLFGFFYLIYCCGSVVFRDTILAQELDREEMISKYGSCKTARKIFPTCQSAFMKSSFICLLSTSLHDVLDCPLQKSVLKTCFCPYFVFISFFLFFPLHLLLAFYPFFSCTSLSSTIGILYLCYVLEIIHASSSLFL